MNINVKAYPAKDGDCLLICFGPDDINQTYILIDSGYYDTVTNYLIKDLEKISGEGHSLEKFIITHIDNDHIQGAVEFLRHNNSCKIIDIDQIWHNTYRHLFNTEPDPIEKSNDRILQQIIKRGYPKDKGSKESKSISAIQGTTVGALILKGGYHWNTDFNQLAVSVNNEKRINVNEDASIYLLSPDNNKLDKLKKLWAGELKRFGLNYIQGSSSFYDDAFEMLLSWEKEQSKSSPKQISKKKQTIEELLDKKYQADNTATNGSSIAFVLQIRERKLLFLADALTAVSMIDACHIVPFSEGYNDTLTNGIALCPNIHRAFDRGLISVSDHYTVLLSKNFIENPSAYNLSQFEGNNIRLPSDNMHHPTLENLSHHRRRFGF